MGSLSYEAPTLTSGSLRLLDSQLEPFPGQGHGGSFELVKVPLVGRHWLRLEGRNFGPLPDIIHVKYYEVGGVHSFDCLTEPIEADGLGGAFNDSFVVCHTQGGEPTGYYRLMVTACGQSSALSEDLLHFPEAPRIFRVEGCQDDVFLNGTRNWCLSSFLLAWFDMGLIFFVVCCLCF